jgi:hypothetical protein
MQFGTVNFLPRFPGALKDTHRMKEKEPQKAPPGAVPPIIPKPQANHVWFYPAKVNPTPAKPAPAPPQAPKPAPERTLEQRVADEVERRLASRVGAFALGFFVGEMVEESWRKHHRD